MSMKERYNLAQFAGINFSNWCFRIKSILRDAEVLKAIEDQDYASSNEKGEAKAQALLIAGVSKSHLEYIKNETNAYEMFKKLEENFKKKGVRSRLFLRRVLNDMKYKEGEMMANYSSFINQDGKHFYPTKGCRQSFE